MYFEFPTTAGALGERFGGTVIGNPDAPVNSVSALESAGEGDLSFLSHRKYGSVLMRLNGAVLFTRADLADPLLPLTYIVVANPQKAFAEVAQQFRPECAWEGISPQAIVHPSAVLEEGVVVAPFAYVSADCKIGARTVVHPYTFIGRKVGVGKDCQLFPRVTLMDSVTIGDRVKIYSGAVIGSEGFGLVGGPELADMPQVGTVVIEDDVRIGANSTVDRATLGETRIGKGSKLDDHVHVGHNCQVGKNCVLCGQVGLSGSVTLEDGVVLGGQVGIADHVRIGKGARMGGQSGTGSNLEGGIDYFLSPAMPMKQSLRIVRNLRKLPEFAHRLKKLEELLKTPVPTKANGECEAP